MNAADRSSKADAMQHEQDYLEELHALWCKSWPKGLATAPIYPHEERPLSEYLRMWAKTLPDRPAVIYYGHVLTDSELDRQSDRFAALLAAKDLRKGDRVVVFVPNMPQFHIVFFGTLKLGAVYVPVNPLSKALELAYELKDTDAEILVALDELMPIVREAKPGTKLREIFVAGFADVITAAPAVPVPTSISQPRMACGDQIELMPALASLEASAPIDVGLDDVAALNYTGGTTGMPKGCIHAQRDMVDTAASKCGIALEIAPDAVFLSFFPEFLIAGENIGLVFPIFSGATLVLMTRWDPVGFMAAVERYRVTTTVLPVDAVVELMEHPRFSEFDLAWLRQVRVVSLVKKLNADYRGCWNELTGGTLAEAAWGTTETHTSDTFTTGFQDNDFDLKSQPIFVGLPVPGTEFKICDFETGALLPLSAEGEIRVRSPSLLKGYWNEPEATHDALSDGWLRTGDIGVIDESGLLHFLGRRQEMLKVKGMSVFPAEIEALLGQHPDIVGSGVVGRPDPVRGPPKGEVRGCVAAGDIEDWCRSRMATYKVPEIRLIEALPMTATGKVKKQELLSLIAPIEA
jgi:fatty-acyl-CoA synthase